MKCSASLLIACVVSLFTGCASESFKSSVPSGQTTVSTGSVPALLPDSATLSTGQSTKIFCVPPAADGTQVSWAAGGTLGGNAVSGFISSGVYTAPAVAPVSTVSISAHWVDEGGVKQRASATLQVVNPVPQLQQVSPNAIAVGSPDLQISVTGSGFNPASKVFLNNGELQTQYRGLTQLVATVPSSLLAGAQIDRVKVTNSSPGGGESADATLSILNPVPLVTQVAPSSIPVGSADTIVALSGSGFLPSSQLSFAGVFLQTTYISPSQMKAVVPAAILSIAATLPLSMSNASPGGGDSRAQALDVMNPEPAIDAIVPSLLLAGSSETPLTIKGTGFVRTSHLALGGHALAATYVDESKMTATIPKESLTTAGTFAVTIANDTPGGGTSAAVIGTIVNPHPEITSFSPSSMLLGSPDFTITVSGSGFLPISRVWLDGHALVSNYIDSSEISAVLPSSTLPQAGYFPLTVSNDSPGGGTSSALSLEVDNPSPILQTVAPSVVLSGTSPMLTLKGSGFTSTTKVLIGGQPVPSSYISQSEIQVNISTTVLSLAGPTDVEASTPAPGGGNSLQSLYVVSTTKPLPTSHPLVARLEAQLPANGSMFAEFGLDVSYGFRTASIPAPQQGGTTSLLIGGMRPSTAYHMRLHIQAGTDELVSEDETFLTGSVSSDRIPPVTVTTQSDLAPSGGIELLDLVGGNENQLRAAAFDLSGNLIWYYDYPVTDGIPLPIKPLSNGNMGVVLTRGQQLYREVDLTGAVVRQITVDELNKKFAARGSPIVASEIHHDFAELPNGGLVLLCSEIINFTDLPGYPGTIPVLGDVLVALDSSFQITWIWSSFDHLDINRHPWFPIVVGQLPIPVYDWTHTNAVVYSERDKSLVISMRQQSWLLKINFDDGQGDGRILWKLGHEGDFTLAGGSDPIDWFYNEHYPFLVNNAGPLFDLALFDNGNVRELDGAGTLCGGTTTPCYSRPIIMRIDEDSRTATLQWNVHTAFSNFGGVVHVLNDTRVEYTLSSDPENHGGGRVVESTLDPFPKEVWRLQANQACYRAIRLGSLYSGISW